MDAIKNFAAEIGGIVYRRRRKWLMFGICLVLILFGVWIFGTQTGELARRSFFKSFGQDDARPQIVTVYNGGEEIMRLEGHFSVEHYQGRLVILDRDNPQEYIDLYGDSAVVIQTSKEEYEIYSTQRNIAAQETQGK